MTSLSDPTQEKSDYYMSISDTCRHLGNVDRTTLHRLRKRAPETGGVGAAIGGAKCEKERELGYLAKEWAVTFTKDAETLITGNHGQDRYDRHIFDLSANGQDVGQAGIAAGVYGSWKHDGKKALEKRPMWCD